MIKNEVIRSLNDLLVKQTREEMILCLKSLKQGDKVEVINKKDNSGSILKKTIATVTMSDKEISDSYIKQGYVKNKITVYVCVKKGGGAIYDYGDKQGIQWQQTMLTPIKEVISIKKII